MSSKQPRRKPNKASRRAQGTLEALGSGVGHTADQAWSLAKKALSLLNVEFKEVSIGYTGSANTVDYNGLALACCSNIAQGTSDSTRNGDSLKLQRVRGPFAFFRNGADAIVKVVITQEQAPAITNANQVCEGKGSSNAPLSSPAWDYRHGFRILFERTFTLTSNDPIRVVEFDLKFDHDVQYVANSTTVSYGEVTIWMFSDQVTTNVPFVRGTGQMSWLDN
jgi:hypothetical protein